MAKRRGNKEGSIYKRKDGRWCAQASLNGRRLTHYAKSQRECREWLKEIQDQIDEGLTIDGARATLGEYLLQWLETSKPSVRPKTWRQYSQIIRQHIVPDLGNIKLRDLRPDHIQAFYTAKLGAGTGARSVRLIHAVLHRALAQALKWSLITRNPASVVDKPKLKRIEMNIWNAQQVRTFLEVIDEDRLEALFYLAVTTGLREGELLGLLWTDLDWETARLQVQRQLQRIPRQGLVLVEPKSDAGRRPVSLGPIALDKLRKHRERQQQEQLFAGERWQEHNLIFTSTIGTPMDPRNLVRIFKALLQQAGLPDIRFHDLRHTAATLMLQQGVHPKVVQERLGHSSITLTLDTYSHVLPTLQEDAAAKLEGLLFQ
jgi:integrase